MATDSFYPEWVGRLTMALEIAQRQKTKEQTDAYLRDVLADYARAKRARQATLDAEIAALKADG